MIRFNYSRVLSQHVFVFATVSFLVVLNISLVSIITLPIFLYSLSKANDREFVKIEQPKIVKICLGILIFDIMIQIMLQTPFYKQESTYERIIYWIQQIGWRLIWTREQPKSVLNTESFIDFISKVAVICVLLVQYMTPDDTNFINWTDDIDELYNLAPEKADCMTYRFNNKKVQKVVL